MTWLELQSQYDQTTYVSTWHDSLPSSEPLRRARLVERGRLAVELHVPRINTRTEDPNICLVWLRTWYERRGSHQGLFKFDSPASTSITCKLWSRLASLPATTQPQLPPPSTMMSTSSGRVMITQVGCGFYQTLCIFGLCTKMKSRISRRR